jgi:hypothetical protein
MGDFIVVRIFFSKFRLIWNRYRYGTM